MLRIQLFLNLCIRKHGTDIYYLDLINVEGKLYLLTIARGEGGRDSREKGFQELL